MLSVRKESNESLETDLNVTTFRQYLRPAGGFTVLNFRRKTSDSFGLYRIFKTTVSLIVNPIIPIQIMSRLSALVISAIKRTNLLEL